MANPPTSQPNGLKYADAGVDIDAGNAFVEAIKPAVKSTARPGSDTEIGGFGGLFDLAATQFKDPILVAANDGVGTKLRVAIEADLHTTVGIDLVAMCVNDLIVQGAEPLFFLDYLATAKLEVEAASDVVSGIAEGCRQAGAALIGGETAEMPGMYHGKDYDLAGFAVGAVERDGILPRNDMVAGDAVLGLSSSGLHSNGFSLVRKVVELEGLKWGAPCPFEPNVTLAHALLEPTKIYVKPILSAIRETNAIKAMAHITGGGFTENIPRVLSKGLGVSLDLSKVAPPPVFGWLAKSGGIAAEEMLRTFNCGVGMIVIVSQSEADRVASVLQSQGETVTQIGTLTEENAGEVSYTGNITWV